ncbi:MAG: hypothetical protein M3O99_11065 [Chloroflexota bacterium]|nr:hypothetical protein [Chloroflexota bacterium]
MAEVLGTPDSEDDLYLARADGVEPYRPFLQGDVFGGITIPGVGIDHVAAMVITHPCSMRRGANLLPRIQMIPVIAYEKVPFGKWALAHIRVFPLPNLEGDGKHFAASFLETGMVPSTDLIPDRRLAMLTEKGLLLLQQRYVHYLTRAVMQLESLQAVCKHVLIEAELHEDWCADLTPPRVAGGEPLESALASEAAEFLAFITKGNDPTLQKMLEDPLLQADVRRRVRQEIARRRGA